MNTDKTGQLNVVTETILGCAFDVSNGLGCGFLEKPYENALIHLLRKAGLRVEQQVPINIWFDGVVFGEYFADLIVEGSVFVELKAVKSFDDVHTAQCINYLKATGYPLCPLRNFGLPKLQCRRYAGNLQI